MISRILDSLAQIYKHLQEYGQAGMSSGVLLAVMLPMAIAVPSMAADTTGPDVLAATDLRCEDLVDPIGIDIVKPRLSWQMRSDNNGAAQTAFQILCASSPDLLKQGVTDLWDSGRIATNQSQHIVYAGKKLARGLPCYWTVQIWNEKTTASVWSKPSVWTYAGMTSNKDWKAT